MHLLKIEIGMPVRAAPWQHTHTHAHTTNKGKWNAQLFCPSRSEPPHCFIATGDRSVTSASILWNAWNDYDVLDMKVFKYNNVDKLILKPVQGRPVKYQRWHSFSHKSVIFCPILIDDYSKWRWEAWLLVWSIPKQSIETDRFALMLESHATAQYNFFSRAWSLVLRHVLAWFQKLSISWINTWIRHLILRYSNG